MPGLRTFVPTTAQGQKKLKPEQLLHWLEQIYATQDAEIGCVRLQAFLPAYVDFVVSGGDWPTEHLAQVRAHLAQCPACAEEYQGLQAVAQLEAQGQLPEVEEALAQFEPEAAPDRVSLVS